MTTPLRSGREVLVYYLRVLSDAEIRQIRSYAQWSQHNYSEEFSQFIAEQEKDCRNHHTALKALSDVLDINLSGETCEPVQGFLSEVERIHQFSKGNFDLTEPIVAQLLHCVKHYEIVTYHSALVLSRNLKEIRSVTTLTEILQAEEAAYLRLQNSLGDQRQKGRILYSKAGSK